MADMALEFYKFLKKEKCLDQYTNNAIPVYSDKVLFFKNIFKQDPKRYITGAFLWDCSPEGYSFWHDINQKWSKLIKKLK